MKHQFQEQNINQLQTGIGDKKLSVEIMANTKYIVGLPFPDSQQEFNWVFKVYYLLWESEYEMYTLAQWSMIIHWLDGLTVNQ